MHSIFLPRASITQRTPVNQKIHVELATPRRAPTPIEKWPFWARAAANFRREKDIGLGDTIVHLIGDARSERFKKWFARKIGRGCGCTERQRWLNQVFPYSLA